MIASLAASAASYASRMLSSLLSQLSPTSSSASSSSSSGTDFAATASTTSDSTSNALTGSATPQLSGDVLMTLMAMQQQTSGASSATSTASASSDPLQQLFSAMDTNGDGSVSQSEMESYIENAGGTQAQADSLYTALDQSAAAAGTSSTASAAGISQSQMASAVSQAQASQGGGGHHHHHHKVEGSGDQADSVASSLMQALDTNDDGSVSQDEFTSFVTANGGTSADAANDFATLDANGSGSLTASDFAQAWSNVQAQQTSQSSGSMLVSLLDQFAKASSATASASTTSISA